MNSRTIDHISDIESIIKACQVCCIGMIDTENNPYVLPFNFGYHNGVVYLHSAPEGKKIKILRKNSAVCISFSTGYELRYQNEQMACSYSMKYKSVLAYGTVEFIDDYDLKVDALKMIMQQYSGKEFSFNAPAVNNVLVYCVKIKKFEGRVYGYW